MNINILTKNKGEEKLNIILYANITLLLINGTASLVSSSIAVLVFGLVIQAILLPIILFIQKEQAKVMYASLIFGSVYIIVAYIATMNNNGSYYFTSSGSDDLYFENTALALIQGGYSFFDLVSGNAPNLDSRYILYASTLAEIIKFGNSIDCYSVFMFRQLNAVLMTLSSGLFWSILNLFPFGDSSGRNKKIVSYCFALCPSIWYIASFAFRDILCLFLILLFAFSLEKIFGERHFIYLFGCGAALVLQLYVRSHACVAMVLMACAYIMFTTKHNGLRALFVLMISAIIIFIVANYSSQLMEFLERGASFAQAEEDESGITKMVTNMPLFPFGIVMRFFYGFILPNPSFSYLFTANDILYGFLLCLNGLSTLLILACMPLVIKGALKPIDQYTIAFVAIYGIFLLSMSFRQIILAYPFLFLLILRGSGTSATPRESKTYFLYLFTLVGIYIANSIARI